MRRPLGVWVAPVFYALSGAFQAFTGYLIFSGEASLDATTHGYYESLTAFDYAATAVLAALNLAAAVAMCLLRKAALPLFLCALGLNLVLILWYGATKGWMETVTGAVMTGGAIGAYLDGVFALYAWKLARGGLLK